MLPKHNRLPGYLISEVLSKGKTIQSSLFGLKILDASKVSSQLINFPLKHSPLSNSFFAFIFSTKLDKRASKRNKAKRRLRETVRLLLPKIKPGYLVVFLAKKAILEVDFKTISREVEKIFQNAKLLKK